MDRGIDRTAPDSTGEGGTWLSRCYFDRNVVGWGWWDVGKKKPMLQFALGWANSNPSSLPRLRVAPADWCSGGITIANHTGAPGGEDPALGTWGGWDGYSFSSSSSRALQVPDAGPGSGPGARSRGGSPVNLRKNPGPRNHDPAIHAYDKPLHPKCGWMACSSLNSVV